MIPKVRENGFVLAFKWKSRLSWTRGIGPRLILDMLSPNQFKISPWFAGIVIFGLLVLTVFMGWATAQTSLLMTRGMTVVGTALSAHPRTGRHHPAGLDYNLDYSFEYEGVTYHGSSEAPTLWVSETILPAPLRIRFLPGNPNLIWPPDIGIANPLPGEIFGTLLPLALAIIVGVKAKRDLRDSSTRETTAPED